jgi:hypothetical protein
MGVRELPLEQISCHRITNSFLYTPDVSQNDLPPGVFRTDDAPIRQTADDTPPLQPDWKDFIALTLAAYSIILPYLFAILGGIVVVFLLLGWLFLR